MRNVIIIAGFIFLFAMLTYCTHNPNTPDSASPYLNQNDTVSYVGKETCRICHADKYDTYIHTGMGLSFDHATLQKTSAVFDEHAIVYDSINNLYYKPYWYNDSLRIMEFRVEHGDTIHKRIETVAYIIGSGQHTNSHLIAINGYIYQAPITFYTQKKKWDMAPGMENGFNSHFSRIIESECMNCHNGLPTLVDGSVNKYAKIPTGIDCERCHGPGGLHVARVSNNITVDTSKEIDYSIVNPKKLSIDLQNQLCMRCHLQGVNVLNAQATYFDFKPGDSINAHWNIFLPRFDGKNSKFLMASQADRMVQSKCFIESKSMSCITCHNPHLTVKETPIAQFNNACITCHTLPEKVCTEKLEVRQLQQDNCSGCHIPKSGAIDIPHVSISDHNIQIPGKDMQQGDGKFLGLKCMTTTHPSDLVMANGYLKYYETFNHDDVLLDSAIYYLERVKNNSDDYYMQALIHYYYLKNDFTDIINSEKVFDFNQKDAWTFYRIGEAYLQNMDYDKATVYFKNAVDILPYNLDFEFKLASSQLLNGQTVEAEKIFAFIVAENSRYTKAWSNLGFIQMNTGKFSEAEISFTTSINLDPDYLQARINLAQLYLNTRQKLKAKTVIDYLTEHYPGNSEVVKLAGQVKSI